MANIQKHKGISQVGIGKWQTNKSLTRYRLRRNKANKLAKMKRRENRA